MHWATNAGRAAFCAVFVYLAVAFAHLIHFSVAGPTAATPDEKASTNATEAMGDGAPRLLGRLANVFGDPVGGARVETQGLDPVYAAADGFFQIDGLDRGFQSLTITAARYRPVELTVGLDGGENRLTLQNETGLWPVGFAVDFHVFRPSGRKDDGAASRPLLAAVGLANGGETAIYVHSMRLVSHTGPGGNAEADLLPDAAAYERIAVDHGGLDFAAVPRPALVLAPRAIVRTEFRLANSSSEWGAFALEVRYGGEAEHFAGRCRLLIRSVQATAEADYDPHR